MGHIINLIVQGAKRRHVCMKRGGEVEKESESKSRLKADYEEEGEDLNRCLKELTLLGVVTVKFKEP